MKRFPLWLLSITLCISLAYGQRSDQKVGMMGAKFLSLPVGPRAVAMGEAYTAMANDASSVFWNPAGLTRIKGSELFASTTQWPADIQFEAAAIILDAGNWGKFGFHALVLHMGDMRVRTAYFPEGTGEMFTASSFAGGISVAKNMTDRFSVGLNLKYVREEYYDVKADGWAVDVGSVYETGWRGMKLGMSMSNFGPDMAFDGTYKKWYDLEEPGVVTEFDEYSIPLTFRFGITMDLVRFQALGGSWLTLVADATHPPDNRETVNFGVETAVFDFVKVRAGYKAGVDEGGLTAGAGVKLPFAETSADVSYSGFGILGDIISLSVAVGF